MPRFKNEVMSEAVAYAKNASDEEAALRYRVKTPTIKMWRELFSKENCAKNLPPNKAMEKKLAKWIVNRMKGGRRPTLSEISWKGLAIARRVGANEYPPTTSRGWILIKKVKLLERWQSCLQDERMLRAVGELEPKVKKYKTSRKMKKRSTTCVQNSFGHSNEQLIDWLNEKLERRERPTLKQISVKGLEIRRRFGGREFVPSSCWGQTFLVKHGLLEKWRTCLKREMVTKDDPPHPIGPSEIKIKVENSDDVETISRQDFQILDAKIREMNLKYEILQKDFLQIKQEHDTLLDLYKQRDESVKQDWQTGRERSHNTVMDEAIQYAELHGNQEAITKFNISAKSFYEYLFSVKECEFETASSPPSEGDEDQNLEQWQTLDVAREEVCTARNELSDHYTDSIKILQIKSKAPVEQMQLSDSNGDKSLLPSSESSNNQLHRTEVTEENVQNHEKEALDCGTSHQRRLSSTETNDENLTVCGISADESDRMTSGADDTHTSHSADDAVDQEHENTTAEESQIIRLSGGLKEKEFTELLEEAEYHKKMLHLCEAMYENRNLPSETPKKPTLVASRMLQKILGDQPPVDKVLQAHQLLYQTLDKNIEKNFDIQREEEDTVTELRRLFVESKKLNPLPYYAAIGGILHQAQHDIFLQRSISPILRWCEGYTRSVIKIHFMCEKYPIFKCLHINVKAFIMNMPRITRIMARDECRQAWHEASVQRGLSFPT